MIRHFLEVTTAPDHDPAYLGTDVCPLIARKREVPKLELGNQWARRHGRLRSIAAGGSWAKACHRASIASEFGTPE